jgi:carnosine N-methyltransferase
MIIAVSVVLAMSTGRVLVLGEHQEAVPPQSTTKTTTTPLAIMSSHSNNNNSSSSSSSSKDNHNNSNNNIPFFTLHKPDWRILDKVMEKYRQDCHAALQELSRNLEVALESEEQVIEMMRDAIKRNNKNKMKQQQQQPQPQPHLLSFMIQNRIDRLSALFEEQVEILQNQILIPFDYVQGLQMQESATATGAAATTIVSEETTEDEDDDDPAVVVDILKDDISHGNNNMTTILNDFNRSLTRPRPRPRYNPQEETKYDDGSGSGSSTRIDSSDWTYDSALQVVAHVVRDWSTAGQSVRESLYTWCRQQLQQHLPIVTTASSSSRSFAAAATVAQPRVLVPGAGLGRLAWELMMYDNYNVQAVEVSLTMAAAAATILQRRGHRHNDDGYNDEKQRQQQQQQRHQYHLYPFVNDHLSNEVDSERRYDSIQFPDVHIHVDNNDDNDNENYDGRRRANDKGFLSYTVGDFLQVATLATTTTTTTTTTSSTSNGTRSHSQSSVHGSDNGGHYHAIVTCFFLDTATNIFDYISTIHAALIHGGIWVNVGPLHWHRNALLPALAVDELYRLLVGPASLFGFEALHWSVDAHPMPYRATASTNTTSMHPGKESSSFPPLHPFASTMNDNNRNGEENQRRRQQQQQQQQQSRYTHAFDSYCPLRFVLRKP